MAKITIIGAGFAGLTAIRLLRRNMPQADITLIAPQATFLYYPSLIWIPTGLRTAKDILLPLGSFLQRMRVHFHQARVLGLKDGGRIVVTTAGEVVNEALIIASGGRGLRALPGIEHSWAICDGLEAAEAIRDRLNGLTGGTLAFGFASNPNEPPAVRGGPVFELLFGIESYLRRTGRRARFDLVFFNPMREPGNRLGSKAVARLLLEMEKRHIRTHLGHRITGFDAGAIKTAGGDIAADLIAFVPGMTGPDWAGASGLPLSPGGFIQSDLACQVPGFPGVFVAGDAGSYAGAPDWLPKQGHTADLQAATAVENAIAFLAGTPGGATFKAELVCIVDTRNSGVMVYRTPERSLVLPNPLWHLAKRAFEWRYLRHYRA